MHFVKRELFNRISEVLIQRDYLFSNKYRIDNTEQFSINVSDELKLMLLGIKFANMYRNE